MIKVMMMVMMMALLFVAADAADKCKELKQFLAVGDSCSDKSTVTDGSCDPEKKSCLPLSGVKCDKKKVTMETNGVREKLGKSCKAESVKTDCTDDEQTSPVPESVQCVKSKCTQLYFIGDKCEKDAECLGDNIKCKDGVCTGLAKGKKCMPGECAFGLYCKEAKCATQLAEGKKCTVSSECETGLCDGEKCVVVASAKAGDKCETSEKCGTGLYCANKKCAEIPGKVEASCSSDSDCKGWKVENVDIKCVGNPLNGCDKSCGSIEAGVLPGYLTELTTKASMTAISCTDTSNAYMECLRNNKCTAGGYADPLDANACSTQHCKVEVLKAQSCQCGALEDFTASSAALVPGEDVHCGFVWEWWSILLVVLAALTCCGGITYGVIAFRKKRAAYTPV